MTREELEEILDLIRDFDDFRFYETPWSLNSVQFDGEETRQALIREVREMVESRLLVDSEMSNGS